jgi:hypothetical protein
MLSLGSEVPGSGVVFSTFFVELWQTLKLWRTDSLLERDN